MSIALVEDGDHWAVLSSPELFFVFYFTERALSLRSGGILEEKLKGNFALVR